MRLYFAGPLFCESERTFNSDLAAKIEGLGYEVFLPQEGGLETGLSLETMGPKAWAQAIFELDRDAVLTSDVALFVLDGRVPDEGMCVELGLAYADRMHSNSDRKLIGYSTDFRIFSRAGLNAMLAGALDEVLHDEDSLLKRLDELRQSADRHAP